MSLEKSAVRSRQETDQTAATLATLLRAAGVEHAIRVCERIDNMIDSKDPFSVFVAGLAQVGLQRVSEEAFHDLIGR